MENVPQALRSDLQPPSNAAPKMVRKMSVGSNVGSVSALTASNIVQNPADEQWKEEIAKLELKLAQLEESPNRDVLALCKLHSEMGLIYRDHDAMFDAMEQFDAGISLLEELGEPAEGSDSAVPMSPSSLSPRKHARAHLQYELGLTAKALQDILQAIENFISALRELDSEKHKDMWLKLHFELGYCFSKTDQPKKAMDFCNTFLRESATFSRAATAQSKFMSENWESILTALLTVGESAVKVGLNSLAKRYLKVTTDLAGSKFKEIEEKAQEVLASAHSLPGGSTPQMQRDASTLSARSTDSDRTEKTSTKAATGDDAESASSDWDDLIADDAPPVPKFSLVLAENNIGVDAENPKAELNKFRLLHEQKSFIAVKYPIPTVLYSIRTTDGHTLLNETELETWLVSLILKYKDSVASVKTIDHKDPLAAAKMRLNQELSKLKPYSSSWLSLHLSFLHRLYLSAEYSAECWAQLRTFFTDLRLHVTKEYKAGPPPRIDTDIVQLPIHVVHLACKMWRPDKADDFNIILQAISALGPHMENLSKIVWAETASHYRIVSAKPTRELCHLYHSVKKHLDAAAPGSEEAATCIYLCSRALSNLQLHLAERSALTGSHPKDSEDSMLSVEDLPRDDVLWDENVRITHLTELYSKLAGSSFVKAKCAFALGLAKIAVEDFDTAERLFFESLYMLDILEPPAEGIRPVISELGNNVIICYAQMLQANYKYKYAVHAFDAGLLLLNMRGRREEYFGLMRAVARIAQEQSDYMRAVDLYTEIVENYRERRCINEAIYVYDILCGLYLELGQFKQAIKSLTMASELLPDHKKFFGDEAMPPTGSTSAPGTPYSTASPSLGPGNPLASALGGLRQVNFDPLFLKLQLRISRAHLSSYNYDAGVELLERLLRCKVPHSYLVSVIETLARAYIKKRWLHEAGQALQTLRDLSLSPTTSTSSTSSSSSSSSKVATEADTSLMASEAMATYWELSARNYLHHRHLFEGLYCVDRAIHLSVSSRYGSTGRFYFLRGKILHELFRNSSNISFPPLVSQYPGPAPLQFAPGGSGTGSSGSNAGSVSSSSSSSPADAPGTLSGNSAKRPGYSFPSWQAGLGTGDDAIFVPAFQSPTDLLQECNATYRTAYNFFRNTGDDPRICKTVSAIASLMLHHLFWPITTKETTFDDISTMPIFEPSPIATDAVRDRSAFGSHRVSVDMSDNGAVVGPGTSASGGGHWGPNGRPHSERSRRGNDAAVTKSDQGTGIFKSKHQRTQSEVSSPRKGEVNSEKPPPAPAAPTTTAAVPIPIPAGGTGSSRRLGKDPGSASSSVKEKAGISPIGSPLDSDLSDSSEVAGRSSRRGSSDRHRSKSRERSTLRGKSRDPPGAPSCVSSRKGADTPGDRSPLRSRVAPATPSHPSHSDIESSNEPPSGSEKSTPTKDGPSPMDSTFSITLTTISNAIEVALEVSLRSCNILTVLHCYLDLAELRFLEGKKETSQTFLVECKEWLFSVFFGDGVQPILKDAAPGFIERMVRIAQRATRLLFMFEKVFVNRHLELVDAMLSLETALEQVRRRPVGDVNAPGRSIGTEGSLPAQLAAILRPKSGGGFLSRPRSGLISPSAESPAEPSSLSASVGDLPSYHAAASTLSPGRALLEKKEAAVREMAFNLWGFLSYVRQQELRNVEGKITHSELHERCEKVVRKILRIAQTARSSEPEQIVQMNEKTDMQSRLARRASRRLTLMTPLKKGDHLTPRERTDSSLSSLSSSSLNLSGIVGSTPLRSPRKAPSFEDVVDKSTALSKVVYTVQLEDRVIHYTPLTGAKRMQRFGKKSDFARSASSKLTSPRPKLDMIYVMIELLDKSHESITVGVPAELPLISVLDFLCDRNNWELDGNTESSTATKRKAGLSFFGLLGTSTKEERAVKKVHRTSQFFKEFRKLLSLASHKKKRKVEDFSGDKSPRSGSSSPKKGAPKAEAISAALSHAARSTSKGELSGAAATSVVSLAAKRGQATRYQTSSIYPLRSKMNAPISECFTEAEYRDNSPEKPVKLYVYLSAAASRGNRGGLSSSVNETLLFSDQVVKYLNGLFGLESSDKDDTPEAFAAVDAIIGELRHAFSPLLEILPEQDEAAPQVLASSKDAAKAAAELWSRLIDNPGRETVSTRPLRLICTRLLNCFPWELIFPLGQPVVRCTNLDDLLRQPGEKPVMQALEPAKSSLSDSKKGRRTESSSLRSQSRSSSSGSSGSSSGSSTLGPFSFLSCFFSQGQRAVQAAEQIRRQRLTELLSVALGHSSKMPEFSPDQAAFFPFHSPLVRVARKISHYRSKYKGIQFVDLLDHLSDPRGPVVLASTQTNPVMLFCYGDLMELSDLVVHAAHQLDCFTTGTQPTLLFVSENRMKSVISRLGKLLSSYNKAHGVTGSKYQQLMVAVNVVQRELHTPIIVLYPPSA